MIVGTAGHIDHGKTALVRALTGVDTDRLPEEKARGITHRSRLCLQPLRRRHAILGFVDVPGHERLVHNMLAGAHRHRLRAAGGRGRRRPDAADPRAPGDHRPARPRPRRRGADQDRSRRRRAPGARRAHEIDGAAGRHRPRRRTGFPAVSSVTGEGSTRCARISRRKPRATPGARRPRPLPPRGRSLLHAHGRRHCGDRHGLLRHRRASTTSCVLSPRGLEARVRGIHAQNRAGRTRRAGERCALNLAGAASTRTAIARGDWVVAPELHAPTDAARRLNCACSPREAQPLRIGRRCMCISAPPMSRAASRVLRGRGRSRPGGRRWRSSCSSGRSPPCAATASSCATSRRDATHRRRPRARSARRPRAAAATPQRIALLAARSRRAIHSSALRELLATRAGRVDLARYARHVEPRRGGRRAPARSPTLIECRPGGPVRSRRTRWDALQDAAARYPRRRARTVTRSASARIASACAGCCTPRCRARCSRPCSRRWSRQARSRCTARWVHLPSHAVKLSPPDEKFWNERHPPLLRARPFNPPRVRDIARSSGSRKTRVRRLFKRWRAWASCSRWRTTTSFRATPWPSSPPSCATCTPATARSRAATVPRPDRHGPQGRDPDPGILRPRRHVAAHRRQPQIFQDSLMQVR